MEYKIKFKSKLILKQYKLEFIDKCGLDKQ